MVMVVVMVMLVMMMVPVREIVRSLHRGSVITGLDGRQTQSKQNSGECQDSFH